MRLRTQGIDHVALTVGDQRASAEWYRDVLGLEREHADAWGDTPVALVSEGSGVALFEASEAAPRRGLRHIAFRVDRENFDAARDHLAARGIPTEFADHGVSHSLYFEDPDGLQLELTTYEL